MRAEQREQAVLGRPLIDDSYPEHGTLVGTVTPLLTVEATSLGGGTQADFHFYYTVCEVPEEVEAGNPQPPRECFESGRRRGENTWRVPAGKLKWGQEYDWQVRVVDPVTGSSDQSDRQSFTTGARQPLNSALLGTGKNREFSPVLGNYATSVTDAQVATAGPPLEVTRTYNSLDPRTDGMFGAGWSTVWDMKLVEEPDGLLVYYPDGRRVRFADKGDGTYQPPPGMHALLAAVDGGGWRLMDKSSTSYHFDSSGRLLRKSDARGRDQTLEYGSDGKLTRATAAGGRSLHFTWSGSRVASVSTDPVDGESATWTYSYSGDTLTSVCAPTAAPNCTTYTYQNGSRYRGLVRDSDPVGYWRLGDARYDPAANEGSDGRSGIYKNVTAGLPGALGGSTDTAAGFTKSYVALPFYLLSRLQEQVSIEAWFKTSQSGILLSAGQFGYEFGATEPVVYVGVDGRLRGQMGSVRTGSGSWSYTPITTPGTVNDDQWHHVVLNVDGTRQELFLDGQSVGVLNANIEPEFRSEAYIGSGDRGSRWSIDTPGGPNTSGAFPFKGSIDEFAIYGKPLTEAEIQAHYAARAAAPNKLQKITLPSGRVWAENVYDTATDRLVTHTDRHGGTWRIGKPTRDWTTKIATVKVTDPRNGTLTYGYDEWRGNRLVYEIDQAQYKAEYHYDTGGYPSRVKDRNGNVTRRYNDKRGNVLRVRTCRSRDVCHSTYSTYHVNESDKFDPRNDRRLTYRDARSSSETDNRYLTKTEYNEYGEQIKQTTPATPDFPDGRSATVSYTDGSEPAVDGGSTPAGLVKSQTDYRGKTTEYAYTSAGDHAETRQPAGLVTRYSHDALGRVVAKTEVSSAHPEGVTSTFTYDGVGRVLSHKGPGIENEVTGVTHTSETSYTYDPDGNTMTETASDLTGGSPTRTITYTYDDFGRTETVTGPEGGTVSYTWNTLGNQTSMVDELGNRFAFDYTVRGELATTTLMGWTGSPVSPEPPMNLELESLSYDPAGRLYARVDAMKRMTAYEYHDDGLLHRVVAKQVKLNGSDSTRDVVLEENTYDEAGNVVQVLGGGRLERVDFTVDAAGRLTSETFDPAGLARKSSYVYDANGNLTKATRTGAGSSRAEVVEFAYNDDDVMIRRTVKNGDQDLVTTWKVDERGLPVEETDPRGNAAGADAADFTTHFRYDMAARLVEVKAPAVKTEQYGAQAKTERPTLRFGYNAMGNRTHEVDEAGDITTSAFDRLGRLVSITGAPYRQPGGETLTPTETFAYNAAGQVTKYTDPRGSTWTTEYDALGNRVRVTEPAVTGQSAGQWVYEYNRAGELRAAVDPTGARVENTYDDLGRMISTTVLERKPTAEAFITKLEYNDAGVRTKEIGPLNRTTSWRVNAAGQVTKETDPAGNEISFEYDLAGRTTKVTDALGNSTVSEYDLAGRRIEVKETNSRGTVLRTTGYGYDLAGNEISETTPEGHTIRSVYDATDLLTEITEPVSDGKSITTTYGYDATGALTRATDGRGNTFWTTYNSMGLAEKTIEPATAAHPDEADRTWTYVYDAGGNMVSALQPGGVRIDHTYDQLGRIVRQTGSGAEAPTPEWTFGYDARGRSTTLGDYSLEYNDRGLLTKVAKGGTQTVAFTYDAYGNPVQKQDVNGTTSYGWDAADRLRTLTDAVSGRSLTYDYDPADRLKTLTSANPGGKQEFDYDDLDRITSHVLRNAAGGQLSKISYGWDKNDNLISKVTEGTAGAGSNSYTYDRSDRMTSWTSPDGTKTTYEWDDSGNRVKVGGTSFVFDERNRLLSGGGTEYTYTPRGTLATETTGGVTKQLKFDAFDNLVSDGDATYTYDNLGRLTSRTQGGVEERFVYAGIENDMVAVTDTAGAVKARFGRDPDGRLVSLAEGGLRLGVLSDQHDDVVATFSGDAIVDSTAYNPFGEVIASSGTTRRLGYQGEYTDPVTGKVNMASRWYVPGTGGFASRDDWTIDPYPSINLNRYTYASANPLAYTDPSGNCPFCVPLLFMAVRVVAQVAIRAAIRTVAKQGLKQTVKHVAKQTLKQGVKKTAKKAAKKVTKQTVKKAAKKVTKKVVKKVVKKTVKKATKRAKKTSKAAKPKVNQPKPKQPKANKPKPKKPAPKNPKSKSSKAKSSAKKPGKNNSKNKQKKKNETAQEATEQIIEDAANVGTGHDSSDGFDAPDGGFFLCSGLGSCVKEVVEEVKDNIADEVIEALIDNTIPDLPIDTPGSGFTENCQRPSSFVPGTPVLMADGTQKPIEQIKAGEEVLAADPATGRIEARPVVTLITSEGKKNLVDITVTTDGDQSDVLTATDTHPFWLPKRQAWVNAGDLQPGMWLQTSAGTYVQISAIQRRTATQRVHNLTVEGFHTYHVLANGQAILVHNDGGVDDYLYRGIPEGHWFYKSALRGIAPPLGGHSDPARHNGGNTRSKFTSWTTDLDGVARDAAEEMGPPGIVMRIRRSAVSPRRVFESPDIYGESEVLIAGIQTGADISIGGGPWRRPGC